MTTKGSIDAERTPLSARRIMRFGGAAMHRIAAVPFLILPFIACSGADAQLAGPPPVSAELQVGFGGLIDTITITAIERLPLRAAELVAPDGTVAPANSITVDPNPRAAVGQFARSNPWRDAVGGYNALPALALQNAQAGAAMQSQVQLLATLSTADIPLPDPAAYRRDWAQYRIRLTFGTSPAEVETRELPAPSPPPAAR